MNRSRLQWLAWTGFGLALLASSFVLLAMVCRYRDSLPFHPGIDPVCLYLPVRDWTGLLSGGYILFLVAFFLYWLVRRPGRIPYLIAATGFLMLVRDLFLVLTPVSALPGLIPLYTGHLVSGLRGTLLFDQELFFSGHTGVPFLYFLLSRRHPPVSAVCLAVSLLNGMAVILTRNHYSLDVLGAFFIVPTIAILSRRLFGRLDPEPEGAIL